MMLKYATAEEKHRLWLAGAGFIGTWLLFPLAAAITDTWYASTIVTAIHWTAAITLGVIFARTMVSAQKRAVIELLSEIHSIAIARAKFGQFGKFIDGVDLKVSADENSPGGIAVYTRYWNDGTAIIPAPYGASEEWENETDVFGNARPDPATVSTEKRRNRLWRAIAGRFRRDSVLGSERRD